MQSPQEYSLRVAKTARYYTLGTLDEHTKKIWFVCHGYGQLAAYFIKKFDFLAQQGHFIVAPEALSKFYQTGMDGRVGATWMTKEDRASEISDYIDYLNQAYRTVMQPLEPWQRKPPVNVLGFSQAGATVNRWVLDGKADYDTLILWAGTFAHDMDYTKAQSIINKRKLYFVYGTQDEFFTHDNFMNHLKSLEEKGISPQVFSFEGKHDLDTDTLAKLADL